MRYTHTVAQSGEILRMVIPQMAQHPAAYTPVTYTLWYEHVAKINPELSNAINQLTAGGARIDDAQTATLYQQHVLDAWSRRTLTLNTQIEKLLDTFEDNSIRVTTGANDFGQHWQALRQALVAEPDSVHDNLRARILASGAAMQDTITELKQQVERSAEDSRRLKLEMNELKTQALTDPLTGLLNRRGLLDTWSDLMARERDTKALWAAVLFDVDHFKKVNDMYGHLFGDQVLRSVASSIRERTRESDLVARLGGEEFLVLLPGMKLSQAASVAEAIRTLIERDELRCNVKAGSTAKVTISGGVTLRRPSDTLDSLIARADHAMYQAKDRGRNAIVPML